MSSKAPLAWRLRDDTPLEILPSIHQELSVYLIVFRLFILNGPNGRVVKAVDLGVDAGEKNWRVGGNDELGMSPSAVLPDDLKEFQLTPG